MDLRSNRSRSHTPLIQNKISHEIASEENVQEMVIQHSYSTRNKSYKSISSTGSDEVFASPAKQRSEKIIRKVRNRTSDYSSEEGENEITSSKQDAQEYVRSREGSNNSVLSANGQTKSALQVYQEAGEYWNKYPKTDYTYSIHSKDRIEVAPGVIAMPNMSRRSLRRSMEPASFENIRSSSRASYNQDFSDSEEVVTKYSHATLKPTALFRDETDSKYEHKYSEKTIIRKNVFHKIATAIKDVFVQVFTSMLMVLFVLYQSAISGVLWSGRLYYKSVSRILLFDTWLLQKSNQKKPYGPLIALCLIPLFLLTGWWLCAGLSQILNEALFTSSEIKPTVSPVLDVRIDPSPPPKLDLSDDQTKQETTLQVASTTLDVDEIVQRILESPTFQNIIKTSNKDFDTQQQQLITSLKKEVTTINEKLNALAVDMKQGSLRDNAKLIYETNRCCRKQLIHMESYIKRVISDLIGLQGSQVNSEGLVNWLNSIFVAKHELESRLSEVTQNLNAGFERLVADSAAKVMRDVSNKLSAKLQAQTSSYSIGVDSALTDSQVQRIVKEALAVYDADKTGLVDYALEPAGGQILSTRCTESYNRRTAVVSVLGIPFWYPRNSPRTVISPGVTPGECWSFQNFPGFLVIQLSARVNVSAFSLEHIPKSLASGGQRISAPKGFSVWALHEENDSDPWHLGDYEYDLNGPGLQFFAVLSSAPSPVDIVELRVNSNHGHMNYTCLYRFRVHGDLPDELTKVIQVSSADFDEI